MCPLPEVSVSDNADSDSDLECSTNTWMLVSLGTGRVQEGMSLQYGVVCFLAVPYNFQQDDECFL